MRQLLLILGGDVYDLYEQTMRFSKITTIEASNVSAAFIEEELLSRSLFRSGEKVVVIKSANELDDKALECLLRFAKRPTENTFVILHAEEKGGLAKRFAAYADVVEFPEVKPWDKAAKLADWVMKYLQREKITISGQVVQEIVKLCPADRFLIRQELDKLISYIGERKEIRMQDVAAISSFEKEHTLWELTDAFMASDKGLATRLLHKLLAFDVSSFVIVRQLRHVCLQALELCSLQQDGELNIQDRFPKLKGKLFEKNMKFAKSTGIAALQAKLIAIDMTEFALKDSPFDEAVLITKLFI